MLWKNNWSKTIFRLFLLLPFAGWTYQIFLDDLGAQPAQELNHQTGLTVLVFLIANLWIGVLLSMTLQFGKKWPTSLRFLITERRFLGVLTYVILIGHVFLYFALEAFEAKAIDQIFEKTYLQMGSLAFLGMTLLAFTSNNFSVRKLGGKRWKQLHRSVYVVAIFVSIHIFLIEKADLVLFALITIPMWLAQILRLMKFYFFKPSDLRT